MGYPIPLLSPTYQLPLIPSSCHFYFIILFYYFIFFIFFIYFLINFQIQSLLSVVLVNDFLSRLSTWDILSLSSVNSSIHKVVAPYVSTFYLFSFISLFPLFKAEGQCIPGAKELFFFFFFFLIYCPHETKALFP